jgi:glyoxylase-like metal-dependent hydrolase (beta-lactamase superfamily II)
MLSLGLYTAVAFGLAAPAPQALQQGEAARALVMRAVERLGGVEQLRQGDTWFVAGAGDENLSGDLQGLTPDAPTLRPHAERIAVNARRLATAWERRTPRNDMSLRWRRFISREDSSGVVVWTDSAGSMNGGVAPEARRRAMVRRVPHLLLLEAATRGERFFLGAELRDGRRTTREVTLLLGDSLRASLWLDADSAILRAMEYRAYLPGRGDVTVRWEWNGWHARTGADPDFAPRGHRILVEGRIFQDVHYTAFESRSSAGDSLLRLPPEVAGRARLAGSGGTVMSMAEPATTEPLPANGEVTRGVHVIPVRGFNAMVVEFADFVVLVEAPAVHPGFEAIPPAPAPRLGAELLARVNAIARGRPLRYVVITHHHSDHIGSVADVVSEHTTVLADQDAAPVVQRLIGQLPASSAARRANVVAVSRSFEIADSTRTLVVHDLGKNPHTNHNLFAWLPRERVGFQGDLFYYDAGMGSPPDRMVMNRFFAEWIAAQKLEPRGVYGVHSSGGASLAVIQAIR